MKKRLLISLFGLLMVTVLACRDDEKKAATGCQSCINDYCDCVDGETNAQVLVDCAESASTCVNSKCTAAEAQDVDYTSCGVGNGNTDNGNTDNNNPGSCESCVDDYCVCSDGVTDAQVLAICAQASVDCATARCTPEETSNLDFNVCNADPVPCQNCIDTVCFCLADAMSTGSDITVCNEPYYACVSTFCVDVAEDAIDLSCLDALL